MQTKHILAGTEAISLKNDIHTEHDMVAPEVNLNISRGIRF